MILMRVEAEQHRLGELFKRLLVFLLLAEHHPFIKKSLCFVSDDIFLRGGGPQDGRKMKNEEGGGKDGEDKTRFHGWET